MNQRTAARVVAVVAVILAGLVVPGPAQEGERRYSGIVLAVDRSTSTVVIEGMGPWQVREGVTQLDRRTILVAPSAEFVRAARAAGAAPSGWSGDWVETRLPAWQLRAGDWVTVTLAAGAGRPTAVRLLISEPSGP